MRVFVAGAAGAIGQQLLPQLVARGTSGRRRTTRNPAKADAAARAGRRAGDPGRPGRGGRRRGGGPGRAGGGHPPDDHAGRGQARQPAPLGPRVRRHQPAAQPREPTTCWPRPRPPAPGGSSPRATRAGQTTGRAGRCRPRTTRWTRTRPRAQRETLAAIRAPGAGGPGGGAGWTAWCCGTDPVLATGPATSSSTWPGSGKVPVIGSGAGIWSFLHVADAATATAAAVEHGSPGRLQRGGRRASYRGGMAAVPGAGGRRQAAVPGPGVARPAGRGRGGDLDDDPDPRLRRTPRPSASSAGSSQLPSWRQGFPRGLAAAGPARRRRCLAGTAVARDQRHRLSAVPAADVLHRLPDAGQRQPRPRTSPGGVPALPRGAAAAGPAIELAARPSCPR